MSRLEPFERGGGMSEGPKAQSYGPKHPSLPGHLLQ